MAIIAYHSTVISTLASVEAADTTTSQILLSRAVASSSSGPVAPSTSAEALSANTPSLFENSDRDIMALGQSAAITSLGGFTSPNLVTTQVESVGNGHHSPNSFTKELLNKVPDPVATNIASEASSRSFHLIPSNDVKIVDKEKGKGTERGRPLERTTRQPNPLSRAGSRSHQNNTTIDVGVQSIAQRVSRSSTFFDDPTDPRALLEDAMLEPCPRLSIRDGVSEILEVRGSDLQRETERLDSCYPSKKVTPDINSNFVPNEHLHGSSAADQVPLRTYESAASSLPYELIRQVYLDLSPVDFNSARHVSRAWFITSLDRSLLELMLRRGGWSISMQSELLSNVALDSELQVNVEWLMSKRVARECALGPDWAGNGLAPRSGGPNLECHCPKTSFVQTSATDLTELGVHYVNDSEKGAGLIFCVSTCGQFLMVASGCLVYVYELNRSHHIDGSENTQQNGSLRPVTSVVCPRRVLSCSMDTSSGRYAVAVLMEGRMGLVCALKGSFSQQKSPHSSLSRSMKLPISPVSRDKGSRSRVLITPPTSTGHTYHERGSPSSRFPVSVTDNGQSSPLLSHEAWQGMLQRDLPSASIVSASSSSPTPTSSFFTHMTDATISHQPHLLSSTYTMTIEKSPPTLYHPLCSADDPPRSVALCPQRRCVAFGCSSGIELHWVDALTGQDLNRWFPLTAPSDYLYFLPPRAGIDSVKKLRLISSAGRPSERAAIAERFHSPPTKRRRSDSTKSSNFWSVLGGRYSGNWVGMGSALSDPSGGTRDNSDHYRAVPLSDGYHILFTDPATGWLCLGSDAPIGGPTKLLRKIWFMGPGNKGSPVIYAGGSDLSWGVRVVAAYGDAEDEQSVWLFSVSRDVFKDSMADQGLANLSFTGQSTGYEGGNSEWMKWWDYDEPRDWLERAQGLGPSGAIRYGMWPVKVRGQEIGKCRGLVDITIDAGPAMTIWAFGREGLAKTWQLDDGTLNSTVKKRLVVRDGTVREEDDGGDMEMFDVASGMGPSLGVQEDTQRFFDGSSSPGKQKRREQEHEIYIQDGTSLISGDDTDGGLLMGELSRLGRHSTENWDYISDDWHETVSLADYNGKVVSQSHRFMGRSYISTVTGDRDGMNLVEALTGIARIEIDIR